MNPEEATMNPTHPLDVKTLLHLLTVDGMPHGELLRLVAQECGIPEDRFIAAVTAKATEVPGRKHIKWTPERMEELITQWNNGVKPRDIADAFGCSTQIIYQRINTARRTRTDVASRGRKGFPARNF